MKTEIQSRKSQRTFTGELLKQQDEVKLLEYIKNEGNLIGPFGHKITMHYVLTDGKDVEKISTYGVIKNAPAYVVAVCENSNEALLDCGYVFEKFVLFLESMGIGTCWLGGTFKREQFKVAVGKDAFIPVISPVGYGRKKKALTDRLVRSLAKADQRLPFDSLFFYKDFNTNVTKDFIKEQLELVRIGPSASNKQPWRILMEDDQTAHLFLERTPNYGRGKLSYDIQRIDIGIAMSHYEIGVGEVEYLESNPNLVLSEYSEYIITMKTKAQK